MAKNYYIQGWNKEPVWTTSSSAPRKRQKERHSAAFPSNFTQMTAKVDEFCAKHGISHDDVKISYGFFYADVLEPQEKFDKRVETWKSDREKYKVLRDKWIKQQREAKAKTQREMAANANTTDEFIVVKLTPAQYSRLVSGTR